MKSICIQDYTRDEMFQKKLLMFLPFYILRYENSIPTATKKDVEKLEALLEEYRQLFDQLKETCERNDIAGYTDLYSLAMRIIKHVVKSEAVRRRFADMGGKVLTLESEKLIAQGKAEGLAEGLVEGGNKKIYELVQKGLLKPIEGAKDLNISIEELKAKMELTGFSFPD